MRAPFGVVVAIASVLCGCAFDTQTSARRDDGMSYEYDVKRPSHADITRARRLLRDVAAAAGIPRHFGGVYSPEPLAVYIGDDVFFHAVVEHGELRIELSRSHSPPTAAFTRTKDLFDKTVAKTFGSRAVAHPPVATKIMYAY
jgi:hypothetical protein